jgi:hypothetical protein
MMKKILYFCLTFMFAGFVYAGSADKEVEGILDLYFVIQASLAKDSTQGLDLAAQRIDKIAAVKGTADPRVQKLLAQVEKAAKQIQGKDLKQTREQFFELSKPLLAYLHQFYSGKRQFYRYFCSMAKKGWIQPQKPVRNPYFGSSMLTCGNLIS